MSNRVIVTDNINEEYRKATSKAVTLEGLPKEIQDRMKRRATSGVSVDRVADQYYNPFLQTTEIEVPKDRKERNRWYRYFFLNEPLVHSALTLHTMFPLSSFRVSHEDKEIEDEFNAMIEDIRLFDFILELGLEYWITGEAFPFGFFDDPDDPKMWIDFILLHPNFVEVEGDPWVRGKRKKHIWLTPTDSLKKLVEGGPNDPKTGELYKNLPPDIIEGIKVGKIELGDVQISHIKRPGIYFNTRGTSIIDCILKALMYRDKLRSAQYSIADRHISPCHDEQTECLTKVGWKRYEELTLEDDIATFNISNGLLEYQKPEEIYIFPHKGDLVHFKKNRIDVMVTPNHRMLVKELNYDKVKSKEAKKVKKNIPGIYTYSDWKVVEASKVKKSSIFRCVINNFIGEDVKETIVVNDVSIPIDIYLEFVGYYLSEGTIWQYKKEGKDVSISQMKHSRHYQQMKIALEKFPLKFTEKLTNRGCAIWSRTDTVLCEHIIENYGQGSFNKKIPVWVKNLSPRLLKILIDAMVRGDGSVNTIATWNNKTYSNRYINYYTVSKQLADDVQEIVFKCGYAVALKKSKSRTAPVNWAEIYTVYWSETTKNSKFPRLTAGKDCIQKVSHTGYVWCVKVPNKFFVTRRNGKIGINHNTEFYFIGEPGDPADEDELEKFQNALVASWTQPNRAIIWHHAVKVQWEGAAGRILPLQPEFDMIDNQILIGLMVSKGVIFGEGPTFANASVALDILIQRYLSFRMQIEKWIENCVFAPICKIHGLYKPTQAEIKHRIRIKGKDKPLWIPQVKWDKENLRDNMQKLEFMSRLAEKEIVPWKMVTNLLDLDWETIKKGMVEQRKERGKIGLPSPVVPTGAVPTGLPTPPTGSPVVEITPAEGPLEGGGPIPSESHQLPEVPTGG